MDSTMLLSVRKTVILSAVALAMAFTGAATVRPCLNCLNLTLPDGQIQAAPTQTPTLTPPGGLWRRLLPGADHGILGQSAGRIQLCGLVRVAAELQRRQQAHQLHCGVHLLAGPE